MAGPESVALSSSFVNDIFLKLQSQGGIRFPQRINLDEVNQNF